MFYSRPRTIKPCQPAMRTATALQSSTIPTHVLLAVYATPFPLPYAGAAHADRNRVAEFAASGLLFKDQVEVTALDDPESEYRCCC